MPLVPVIPSCPPDFKLLLPLVSAACEGAYERDEGKARVLFESYGMTLETIWSSPETAIYVAYWNGELVLAVRGTQFFDGFSLPQVLDNERMGKVSMAPFPGYAMDGYLTPLKALLADKKILFTPRTWAVGQSMGGIRALMLAAFAPFNIDFRVVALAPPKGMTKEFSDAIFNSRKPPLVIGRECDFALNHPLLEFDYREISPIFRLSKHTIDDRWLLGWPLFYENIEDHMPERYLSDWKLRANL